MNTYTTVSCDTWDIIAFKIWGKEKYAYNLIEANLQYVDIIVFSSGVKLNVPSISEDNTNDDSLLPPWKRGAANAGS